MNRGEEEALRGLCLLLELDCSGMILMERLEV